MDGGGGADVALGHKHRATDCTVAAVSAVAAAGMLDCKDGVGSNLKLGIALATWSLTRMPGEAEWCRDTDKPSNLTERGESGGEESDDKRGVVVPGGNAKARA